MRLKSIIVLCFVFPLILGAISVTVEDIQQINYPDSANYSPHGTLLRNGYLYITNLTQGDNYPVYIAKIVPESLNTQTFALIGTTSGYEFNAALVYGQNFLWVTYGVDSCIKGIDPDSLTCDYEYYFTDTSFSPESIAYHEASNRLFVGGRGGFKILDISDHNDIDLVYQYTYNTLQIVHSCCLDTNWVYFSTGVRIMTPDNIIGRYNFLTGDVETLTYTTSFAEDGLTDDSTIMDGKYYVGSETNPPYIKAISTSTSFQIVDSCQFPSSQVNDRCFGIFANENIDLLIACFDSSPGKLVFINPTLSTRQVISLPTGLEMANEVLMLDTNKILVTTFDESNANMPQVSRLKLECATPRVLLSYNVARTSVYLDWDGDPLARYKVFGMEPNSSPPVYTDITNTEGQFIPMPSSIENRWATPYGGNYTVFYVVGYIGLLESNPSNTVEYRGRSSKSEVIGANVNPNPFNPETTISYSIPEDGHVRIDVFNVRGQLVRTLVNERLDKGDHSVVWQGEDECGKKVSCGVYLYRIESAGRAITKKMLLLQ